MNTYSSISVLKARMNIPDTLDDDGLLAALEMVSREIDRYCGRHFYVARKTLYCGTRDRSCLRVDDVLSVISIKTDTNGDRTYPTTWAATDYELDPPNALTMSPPEPYTRICTTPRGQQSFICGDPRGNQLDVDGGYYDIRETLAITLAEALDAAETEIDVSDGASFAAGETLLIGTEQLYIAAIASNILTVARGINGTTATTHLTGATIQRYTYPVIGEACTAQAILTFKGVPQPMGEIGSSEGFSQSLISTGLHPFTTRALETFRRLEVG